MSTYETRLNQRKAQFVERARQKLARMADSLKPAGKRTPAAELWQEVTKEFHQLAAAAGIYEIADLADLAVKTEDMLVAAQNNGASPGEPLIGHVLAAIQSMDEILARLSPQNADLT